MFDNEYERDQARDFVNHHHVKRWHGEQEIKFCNRTRYTGKRGVPNKLVTYADQPSRTTGELYCVHIQWRSNGARALRRAGVYSVQDLLNVDPHQFWQERLLMKAVNRRELGKQYNMHVAGKGRRRGPWVSYSGKFEYDHDLRTGGWLLRWLAVEKPEWDGEQPATYASTQQVIDAFGKRFNVNRCLEMLNVEHLLPPKG